MIHYESEKRKGHKDMTWVNIRYIPQLRYIEATQQQINMNSKALLIIILFGTGSSSSQSSLSAPTIGLRKIFKQF